LLKFMGGLLRVYSYVVEALLCLAALAFSAVILASPHQNIRLGWLPWTGETLGAWLAVVGLVGLLCLLLALAGRARFLLALFSLTVFVVVTRGLFFTAWRFHGMDDARNALWLTLALLLAFAGSVPVGRRDSPAYRAKR
jgi:hypothetical protein